MKIYPSLFVVIVLYGRRIFDSVAVCSLMDQTLLWPEFPMQILIFDNSPNQCPDSLPPGWRYHCPESNLGLTGAYNFALTHASSLHCDWLLLLDQDTKLPLDFVRQLASDLSSAQEDESIVACVPEAWMGGILISPWERKLFRNVPTQRKGKFIPNGVGAINSGTCLRVAFLTEIGGFDPRFWLDFLDHWLFMAIERCGRSILVVSRKIEHQLSVRDYKGSVSVDRYRNILDAESRFTNEYLGSLARWVFWAKLPMRAIKQFTFVKEKGIAAETVRSFVRKLRRAN